MVTLTVPVTRTGYRQAGNANAKANGHGNANAVRVGSNWSRDIAVPLQLPLPLSFLVNDAREPTTAIALPAPVSVTGTVKGCPRLQYETDNPCPFIQFD